MALTVNTRGGGTHNTSATSFTGAPASSLSSGDLAVMVVSADNAAPGGSAHSTFTVTDTNGNTWTRQVSPLYDPGAANAGVEGAIFTTEMDGGTITTGTTITVTFGHNTTAKAWLLYGVTASDGYPRFRNGASGTGSATASPTVTTPGHVTGDCVFGGVFNEYGTAQTVTSDSDTTNGSWSSALKQSVGTTAAGQTVAAQYKIVTGTGAQTFNPTLGTSSDVILAWVAITEARHATLSKTLGALTTSSAADVDVVGTLSKTLGAAALSSTAEVAATGATATLAATLGAITLASAGDVDVVGTLSKTLGAATLASAADVDVVATLGATLGAATIASTSDVDVVGSLAASLGALSSSSSAEVDVVAMLAGTLGAATLASAAGVDVVATLSKTLGAATLSASGLVSDGPLASLTATLGALAASASAEVDVVGTVSGTLGAASASSQVQVLVSGSLASTLGAASASGQARALVAGSLASSLAAATLSAAGSVTSPALSASLAATLGALSLSAAASSPAWSRKRRRGKTAREHASSYRARLSESTYTPRGRR